jgi:hypothetical protein
MGIVDIQVSKAENGETWYADLYLSGTLAERRYADNRQLAGHACTAMLRELANALVQSADKIDAGQLWNLDFFGSFEDLP